MNEKIVTLLMIMLFFSITFSSVAFAEQEKDITPREEIHISPFGSSMLIGIRRVGFVMTNIGEDTYSDISWTFTATRIEDHEIVYSYTDITEDFPPDLSTIFSVQLNNDIGYLELTATATCSEFENEHSDTITVFQIGPVCIGKTFLLSTPFL
jgi:hypothetical protein